MPVICLSIASIKKLVSDNLQQLAILRQKHLKSCIIWQKFRPKLKTWPHQNNLAISSWNVAYFHTCMLAYLCSCIIAYLHTYILANFRNCIFPYLHTCILAYMNTCILAYFHTCILVKIHTYIFTYLHL